MNEDAAYRSLVERDRAHMLHPQYSQLDHKNELVFVKGQGAVLTDVRGRDYIDGLSSLWNVAVGHGRKELGEQPRPRWASSPFANGYSGYGNERAIELAEKLIDLTYSNMAAVHYANSGSEANQVLLSPLSASSL